MKLRFVLAVCFIFGVSFTRAQEYFQQHVAYDIDVALDDERHEIKGDIRMVYTNNSPDELTFIWMHLWPNAYSSTKTALAKQLFRNRNFLLFYQLDKVRGGIDSLDFSVDGLPAGWDYHPEHVDIAKIELKEPLKPGASITIATPFRVKLPSGRLSRLGHIGQSYQITQWYPKPAVYDKDGWHEMPYLTQGEFYSEFGSFDVRITLPKNYVLGATGDLVDGDAEIAFLDSIARETEKRLPDYTERKPNPSHPPSSRTLKTLRFKQDQVHDFAWFADKRWMVLRGDVTLENGHNVDTWAMFTPRNAHLWARSIEYINDGLAHYSRYIGPYPYNHCTAVDGTISAGGGMEYPNITVIGNVSDDLVLETVIVHEVGHNWYYGILGSNERINAWMDEGFNSYHETRYLVEKYGDQLRLGTGMISENLAKRLDLDQYDYETIDELAALLPDRLHKAQPMQCHSDHFIELNYGAVVYKKSARALTHLYAYLGRDRFDDAMRAYYRDWSFKHPDPAAVREVFERETGEDLSWFFDDIVQTTGRVNYKMAGLRKAGDSLSVKVVNAGEIPAPFVIDAVKDGEVVKSQWYAPIPAWDAERVMFADVDADRFVIDFERNMLEYDRRNNSIRKKGILRRSNPPQIRFITRIEDPNKGQLFWAPVAAWNDRNGFMLGLNLHNTPFPMRDWEFSLTPLYGFESGTVGGFGRTSLYRGTMDAHLSTQSFGWRNGSESFPAQDYMRNALEVNHRFDAVPNSKWSSVLHIDLVHFGRFNRTPGTDVNLPFESSAFNEHFFVPKVAYTVERKTPFVRHLWEVGGRYAQGSFENQGIYTEAWYRGQYRYNEKGKLLIWRAFGGFTADFNNAGSGYFPLAGFGITGANDIFADYLFLGRGGANWFQGAENLSWYDRQVANDQGNMRIPVLANQWMSSATVELELPLPLPFSVFAGVMAYEDFMGNPSFDYVGGISATVIRNVLVWNLPLATRSLFEGDYKPFNLFTFELHLERVNPKKLIRTIGG